MWALIGIQNSASVRYRCATLDVSQMCGNMIRSMNWRHDPNTFHKVGLPPPTLTRHFRPHHSHAECASMLYLHAFSCCTVVSKTAAREQKLGLCPADGVSSETASLTLCVNILPVLTDLGQGHDLFSSCVSSVHRLQKEVTEMAVNPPPDCQYVVMAQSVDMRQSALYAATWIIVTQSWA